MDIQWHIDFWQDIYIYAVYIHIIVWLCKFVHVYGKYVTDTSETFLIKSSWRFDGAETQSCILPFHSNTHPRWSLRALALSHPALPEVTPHNGTAIAKATPQKTGSHPFLTPKKSRFERNGNRTLPPLDKSTDQSQWHGAPSYIIFGKVRSITASNRYLYLPQRPNAATETRFNEKDHAANQPTRYTQTRKSLQRAPCKTLPNGTPALRPKTWQNLATELFPTELQRSDTNLLHFNKHVFKALHNGMPMARTLLWL